MTPHTLTTTRPVRTLVTALCAGLLATGCGTIPRPDETASVTAQEPGTLKRATCSHSERTSRSSRRSVLAISIDGLRPATIRRLGPRGAPALHRMIRSGASTLNARTVVERTVTLPNHTSMITGRPVATGRGGHGVRMNTDPGGTVHALAGERVSSMFQVAARQGGRPAVFVSKSKFALFHRSWPCAIARYAHREQAPALTRLVLADLQHRNRSLRFVHYAAPDQAGHEHGFTSRQYRTAVRHVDQQLGRLLTYISNRTQRRARTTVVITADHGGTGTRHDDRTDRRNYTIPFLAWGRGVAAGTNLYRLNPDLRKPGRAQYGYRGRQPIRNGDLANLVTHLLGRPPVPGSWLNRGHSLDLRRPAG